MRKVTLDLDKLEPNTLYVLAESLAEEDILIKIYEIGKERNDSKVFVHLAKNHSKANQDNIRKIALNCKDDILMKKILSSNPLSPPEFLEGCLEYNMISDALYNPSTPVEVIEKYLPNLFCYRAYVLGVVLNKHGEKLSEEALKSILANKWISEKDTKFAHDIVRKLLEQKNT